MRCLCSLVVLLSFSSIGFGQAWESTGSPLLDEYFRIETAKLERECLANLKSLDDWNSKRPELRKQLFEMLGLDPLPQRTDLQTVVTGTATADEIVVENLHFQSQPGLYVTGNLYRPKAIDEKLPAILYVCGHGGVKKNGVSYGNKVHYQHHGAWFARNGYVCLTIDSLQLGEIEAIHHGTYRYDRWWWLNRGYTPAGVEAWNCIRALDYLQSRNDVDAERLGVTGRSGGGIYSWWVTALDDRIKAAVPVAGVTDLRNQVIDGCVEGHCDCMFFVNTHRWDYPALVALVSPRPLLLSNTDRDSIFPLDGVVRTHRKVKAIYNLYDKAEDFALHITAGPHKDTQELRIHAFRWFNRHLKNKEDLIETAATKFFETEQLQVFVNNQLPADEKNTRIDETFVPKHSPTAIPSNTTLRAEQFASWTRLLESKVFGGWPRSQEPLHVHENTSDLKNGLKLTTVEFQSQKPFRLPIHLISRGDADRSKIKLEVVSRIEWDKIASGIERLREGRPADSPRLTQSVKSVESDGIEVAFFSPRGSGNTKWTVEERKQTQIRRRFYLLGQTLDGMRVWDILRAVRALKSRSSNAESETNITLAASGIEGVMSLYVSIFEPVGTLELSSLPNDHRHGPFFLNVSRYFSIQQAKQLAAAKGNKIDVVSQ